MDSQIERNQLQLPQRTLEALSFSEIDTTSIEKWLTSLSKTDLKKSARQLLPALTEMTQIKLAPSHHLSLTELFRPAVYSTVQQLSKKTLGGIISFNEQQQTTYTLCQKLLGELLCSYKVVVQTCIDSKEHDSPLPAALHRAMAESASIHLFCCENYRPTPNRLWLEMHSLYLIAQERELLDYQLEDSETSRARKLSLADQYKRSLLLSRCRANQLHPKEIRQVNTALSLWAPHSKLLDTDRNCYLATNLDADQGLNYSTAAPDSSSAKLRGVDVRLLKAHLKKLSESTTGDKPGALTKTVIEHLSSAWSPPATRKHQRQHKSAECLICTGMSAAHFYLSNLNPFDDLVANHTDTGQAGKSDFSSDDAWSSAHDSRRNDGEGYNPNASNAIQYSTEEEGKLLYPNYNCRVLNTSASGYCLNIKAPFPDQLKIGEIMAICEDSAHHWMLAVIRWLHVRDKSTVTIGVELLSAKTKPSAVTVVKKTEDNVHYQRCFILPVVPGINATETIITPMLQFRNGIKIMLLSEGNINKGQLLKCVASTESFSQFEFRILDEPP
ncbi:MAG: hypothetical protein ACR2PT_04440 [Endozoicomonas sp.]